MNLGNIENVELTSTTKTTPLVSKISSGTKSINTLCIDANMRVQYKKTSYQLYGEKEFLVYMYLTDSWVAKQFGKSIPLQMTFTDLKKNFTNRSDIDANTEYKHLLLQNICLGICENVEMDIGSTIEYFFDNPLSIEAHGNWINRGWGYTHSYCIVGINIFRRR